MTYVIDVIPLLIEYCYTINLGERNWYRLSVTLRDQETEIRGASSIDRMDMTLEIVDTSSKQWWCCSNMVT